MNKHFIIANQSFIDSHVSKRAGEVKLGEKVQIIQNDTWQQALHDTSARFVLVGIPEDIGVRANCGTGGTHTLWEPALKALLNIQSNNRLDGSELLVLGFFDFSEWMEYSLSCGVDELRAIVAKIDEEVTTIIKDVIAAGKIPIVIGGGHNNAYPLLRAAATAFGHSINCINSDAHADYRIMEGRHSGNGFRYAKHEAYLHRYAIIGLHENYNSQLMMNDIDKDPGIMYSLFEDIFVRNNLSFSTAIKNALQYVAGNKVGLELDLDCINNVLSSAQSSCGINVSDARNYITTCASLADVAYLHITEGAVQLRDGRSDITTAKLVAYLVSDFIKTSAYLQSDLPGHY